MVEGIIVAPRIRWFAAGEHPRARGRWEQHALSEPRWFPKRGEAEGSSDDNSSNLGQVKVNTIFFWWISRLYIYMYYWLQYDLLYGCGSKTWYAVHIPWPCTSGAVWIWTWTYHGWKGIDWIWPSSPCLVSFTAPVLYYAKRRQCCTNYLWIRSVSYQSILRELTSVLLINGT